jgi:hypothetical protein
MCRWLGAGMLCWAVAVSAMSSDLPPDVVLSGELTGADHESYRELAFQVPAHVDRITVSFDYQRGAGTTVDLGLADPQRFRGWSGGNKSTFTLAETEATPSYLPGPLPAGEWRLVLGVPNIRDGTTAAYRAEIRFQRGADAFTRPFADEPLRDEPGWYRGDLHLHSGHSDGACGTQSGARAPCPLYRAVEAAAARGLDFVAVTEHNTRSHHQGLRELQAAFDRLVLIPGQELTTFRGHANVLGTTGYINFRVSARDMGAVLTRARQVGGLVSVNHPGLPSDENCMGCGWTAEVEPSLVQAMEVVNGAAVASLGGGVRHRFSGISAWQVMLSSGARVTAVAGSDNHDPLVNAQRPASVGRPTTVVHAAALSQPALLAAIRDGRVFVDVEGTRDRLLDMEAASTTQTVAMGGNLRALAGTEVTVTVTARHVTEGRVVLIQNGRILGPPSGRVEGDRLEADFRFPADGQRSWLRAEVVSGDGEPLLLSNPVYLNFSDSSRDQREPTQRP